MSHEGESPAATSTVERAVVARVQAGFPFHASLLGTDGLARLAREAVKKAAPHAITAPEDVASFAATMVMLGSDFAADPLLPWAGELLAEAVASPADPSRRASLLREATLAFLDQTAGCSNEALGAALARIHAHPFLSPDPPSGAEAMSSLLRRLHPERHEAMPRAALLAVEARAADLARRHGFEDPRAVPMFGACLFELGAGFATDPQFPWASAALAAPDEDGVPRLMRFYVEAMVYVQRLRSAVTLRR